MVLWASKQDFLTNLYIKRITEPEILSKKTFLFKTGFYNTYKKVYKKQQKISERKLYSSTSKCGKILRLKVGTSIYWPSFYTFALYKITNVFSNS